MTPSPAFRRFAYVTLAFSLGVIAWGAFVRASGSGAGCGDHWPDCNGEVIPRQASTQTAIEFTHRVTAGLSFLAVLAMTIWAHLGQRAFSKVKYSATASLVFMVLEAALGALLVKRELVANNASANRAVVMSIHLLNTFFLVTALASCCFWASHDNATRQIKNKLPVSTFAAYVLLLLVGMSGAVAALGDTLSAQGVVSPFVELLIQIRIGHPLLAIGGVVALAMAGYQGLDYIRTRWAGTAVLSLTVIQIAVGAANVILHVPLALQLTHLVLADGICIALVYLYWNTTQECVPIATLDERLPEVRAR